MPGPGASRTLKPHVTPPHSISERVLLSVLFTMLVLKDSLAHSERLLCCSWDQVCGSEQSKVLVSPPLIPMELLRWWRTQPQTPEPMISGMICAVRKVRDCLAWYVGYLDGQHKPIYTCGQQRAKDATRGLQTHLEYGWKRKLSRVTAGR